MPQKPTKPNTKVDEAILEILRQMGMAQPTPSHVPGPVQGPLFPPPPPGGYGGTDARIGPAPQAPMLPPPPPGGFGGPDARIGPAPLTGFESLMQQLGFKTAKTNPEAFGILPPQPGPAPAPAAPVAGPAVRTSRDINLPVDRPAQRPVAPSSGPLAALARAVPPTPPAPDAQGGGSGPGATGLTLPQTDMTGATGGMGLGGGHPFGGMSPDLESQIAAMPEPHPAPAEEHASRMSKFWAGFMDAMPGFAVNFASAMLDRPDIAQNYLEERQSQIKAALDQQKIDAQMQENNFQRQMQLANLEMNKVGIRMKANDVATDLQKRVVDGTMSADEYARALVASALDFNAAGGDPMAFLKSHPTPNWAVWKKMRDMAMDFYYTKGQEDPSVLTQAVIPNYLGDPNDPKQYMTVVDVLRKTGLTNDDGVVDLPGMIDLTKIDTNNSEGATTQMFMKKSDLRGKSFTSPPKPQIMLIPNANGDVQSVTVRGSSVAPPQRVGAGQQSGLASTINDVSTLMEQIMEQRIATTALSSQLGRVPSPVEIANWIKDPKNAPIIAASKAGYKAGGK